MHQIRGQTIREMMEISTEIPASGAKLVARLALQSPSEQANCEQNTANH